MKTYTINTYQFNELTKEAKEKAIKLNRDINIHDDWHEFTTDHFKYRIELFGVTNVYFSGFWSQGDGAMFEYNNISDALVNEAIEELILDDWKKNVLKKCTYVSCDAKQTGRYCHEKSVNHGIVIENNYAQGLYPNIDKFIYNHSEDIESYIIDKYEDICTELYSLLESEYEYLISDEAVIEALLDNEIEFTEDGEIY